MEVFRPSTLKTPMVLPILPGVATSEMAAWVMDPGDDTDGPVADIGDGWGVMREVLGVEES